jgi:hypothetical protein
MYKTSQIWLGFNTSQQGIIYLFSGCGIRSDDTYREMGGLLVHQREELEATRFLCTACFASHAERNVMRIIPSLSPILNLLVPFAGDASRQMATILRPKTLKTLGTTYTFLASFCRQSIFSLLLA